MRGPMRQILGWIHRARARTALKAGPVRADFSGEHALWIDRAEPDIDKFLARRRWTRKYRQQLAELLELWHSNGFVILKGLISEASIDEFLGQWDQLIRNHKSSKIKVDIWKPDFIHERIRPIASLSEEILRGPQLKFIHIHGEIPLALEMATHPTIMNFLRAVFDDRPTVKQSLLFRYGSQQGVHQDFAFVVPFFPHHLAASWIALEDIKDGSGPLCYFEGSHRIPVFDFGNGSFLSEESSATIDDFLQHVADECRVRNLKKRKLVINKGDVLLWHAALAHGGERITDSQLTRQSLVTHYTSKSAARLPSWK